METKPNSTFFGTFVADVLDFKGEIINVTNKESDLKNQKIVGPMTLDEQKIYSVYRSKYTEGNKIVEGICGKRVEDFKDKEELEKMNELIAKKGKKEDVEKLKKLRKEIEGLRGLMWNMIRVRNPQISKDECLDLIEGNLIVSGTKQSSIMDLLFSNHGIGFSVVMID